MAYENDMEGIDIVSKMVNVMGGLKRLETVGQEQENLALRGMLLRRELAGPSESEKFQFEQGKFAEQQRAEQVKFTLTKFAELSKDASPASKAAMMEQMKSLWSVMTPIERKVSEMTYMHSPLNPLEQKANYWDTTMPAPKVTADPTKDPYAFGVQVLNLDDYHQQRQNYIAGTPINKRRIMGIGESTFAVRDEHDKVSIMTSQDMQLEQTAKLFNTTVGALIAENGNVYGPEREISVAGHIFKTRSVYDALRNKAGNPTFVPVKAGEKDLSAVEEKLRDLGTAYANQDTTGTTDGSRIYKMIQARMTEGKTHQWIIENVLKKYYPGFNFAFVDPGEFDRWWHWGGYTQGKNEVMTFFKGEPVFLPAKDSPEGSGFLYYYDATTSSVLDREGRIVSRNLPEWAAGIANKTREQVNTIANPKKPGEGVPKAKETTRGAMGILGEAEEITGLALKEMPAELRKMIEVLVQSQGIDRARQIVEAYQKEWAEGMNK